MGAILLQLIVTRFSRRTCLFMLFDEERHLAGDFRGVSGRLCWIFKFCLRFFLVSAGVSFQSGNLLLRTGRNFDFGIFVLNIYFCVSYVFLF